MNTLEIDIETYSSVNLLNVRVYKYAESPDFQIILFGYSVDGGEVKVVDLLNGERIRRISLTPLQTMPFSNGRTTAILAGMPVMSSARYGSQS